MHPRLTLCFVLAALVLPAAAQRTDSTPAPQPGDTPEVFDDPALVQRYQATITPEDLAAHLYLFASDLFEGRETSARGQKLAAHYLAAQYRKMGLQPRGSASTDDPMSPERYLQPFRVYGQRLSSATLSATPDGQSLAETTYGPTGANDAALLSFGGTPLSEGGLVFAGYGIQDSTLAYDDYDALASAGIDVTGKWLLILRDEPLRDAETSRLATPDGKPSRWTNETFSKLRAAFGQGARFAGLLVVDDVGARASGDFSTRAARAAAASQQAVGNLSLNPPQGPGRAMPPVYSITSAFANTLLAPTGRTISEVQAEIDGALRPVVFEVPGVALKSTVSRNVFEASTENVAAFIEGSDPTLKDEVIVISSHYDHIGVNPALDGDQINNGADDDGSGTVATLEIAEAFMQAKADGHGPRRSILFLNVSGEEKGLLGSAYYSDVEPLVPLASTAANLNIDMIGRFDPTHPDRSENYVYIIGSNLISQELHDINVRVNDATGVNVELSERFNSKDDPNQFYRRSDHWNFGKHNIPFIFFFTGTHEDYHQPGDEPDKIEYDRMARISRLVFGTAWQVANQDARPAVTGTGFN